MKRMKTALVVGASVVTLGIGGLGVASAATAGSGNGHEDSLVQKIATKFHLNKSDVQAVFDQDRQEHRADMKTERAAALKQAVIDGKLTQTQADHITATWKEIDTLMNGKSPDELSAATRQQVKDKLAELRTWLKDQNINLRSIDGLGGPGMGHHGRGGMGMGMHDDDADDSSN